MDNAIFQDYKLAKMNVQMNEAFLESVNIKKEADILEGEYINEINFGQKIEQVSDGKFKGLLKTTVLSYHSETNDLVLHIDVIYSGVFEATNDLRGTQLELWVDAQIVPQLLSYTRTIITNLTSHMDIPTIYLPTMDVVESLKENVAMDKQDGE